MSYLYRCKEVEGYEVLVGPHNAPLKYITFGRLRLPPGEEWSIELGDEELVLYVLSGKCEAEAGGRCFDEVGERANPFAGLPHALYVPAKHRLKVRALSTFDAAVCSAPSNVRAEPVRLTPSECKVASVGAFNWRREVRTVVGSNVPAEKLLVGETLNPPGNWSSYPPHKHDTRTETERPLEEVYFFLVNPSQGFGIIRLYTPPDEPEPLDEVYVVRDGDVVVIPRGYHPVAAAPGYTLLYLWVLAGEERSFGAWTDDPQHAWVKATEAVLKEALP